MAPSRASPNISRGKLVRGSAVEGFPESLTSMPPDGKVAIAHRGRLAMSCSGTDCGSIQEGDRPMVRLQQWFADLSRRAKLFVVIGAVVVLLAAIGSLGGSSGTGGTAGDDRSPRCGRASSALVSAIESGLTVNGGGSLTDAYIVHSDDFENAHFVAAKIEGEGIADAVGVWSTNDPAGGGSIFSADALAEEFSDWGNGPGFRPSDDGFSEARDCAAA